MRYIISILFVVFLVSVSSADIAVFQGGGYIPNSDYVIYFDVNFPGGSASITYSDHGYDSSGGEVSMTSGVWSQYVTSDGYGNIDFSITCPSCSGSWVYMPSSVSASDSNDGIAENNIVWQDSSDIVDGPFNSNPLFGSSPFGGSPYSFGLPLIGVPLSSSSFSTSDAVSSMWSAVNFDYVTVGIVGLFVSFSCISLLGLVRSYVNRSVKKGGM